MKQVVYNVIPSGFTQSATIIDGQLVAMVEDDANHTEAVYAAKWDGQKPYVEVLKGDLSMPKLAFAGWPMEDKAMVDAKAIANVTKLL